MRAIILAAGMGTRLQPITLNTPKSLIKIKEETLIERQIRFLREKGVEEIVVVTGYLAEKFEFLKDKYRVTLIHNDKYDIYNNFYSMFLARHYLENAYVIDADNYLNDNFLSNHVENSTYFSAYKTQFKQEWVLHTDENQVVTDITVEDGEGPILCGVSYWNAKDGQLLQQAIEKRFEKGTALGMWEFAAYVLSEDQNIANNVAHTYLALTQGEESYMSKSSVNLWRGDMGESSADTREIVHYLRDLRHPIFALNPSVLENDETYYVYPSLITPTVPLSGQELAYSLNFPQKSIPGLPIIECTEFGRNIVSYDLDDKSEQNIRLGNIFHMNREERVSVDLSLNSLTSHAFITGSTGSGKSNTIYQLLSEARENNVKFLVVEPAKGEYKHVFGQEKDVAVYGTNPKLTPLLRLNPFSFSKEIHILEHLDRLIEIFNVCWPMYAAMPAVLKKAVEKSYIDCGWDLIQSRNSYGTIYPTFGDVAENIKEIIDSSEYDSENKGAYKGSLLTRIESLTNGINGIIFSQDELSEQQLFDSNVIVDLSRIGSSETKSLIMGILVLKLQEYRMSQAEMNSSLRHLTVLEEAHNLLKRTSTEQSSESSNLLGKSVEMLANAIAEMRTYGEGFIIADQAPGLLDLSVIRNTNTKIIMRLPDFSDRELVGRSANLNDDQILELAKLPKGVAAVYQNEWIQPVLCKVEKYDNSLESYQYSQESLNESKSYSDVYLKISKFLTGNEKIENIDIEKLRDDLFGAPISGKSIHKILGYLDEQIYEVKMLQVAPIISEFYPSLLEKAREANQKSKDKRTITYEVVNEFNGLVDGPITQQERLNIIQAILTQLYVHELNNNASLEEWKQQGGLL